MYMRLEANPEAGHERAGHLPNVLNSLKPFLRATALACAAAMTEPIAAQEQPSSPVSIERRELSDMSPEELREYLQSVIPLLDHDDFLTRDAGAKEAKRIIDAALKLYNPLPQEFASCLQEHIAEANSKEAELALKHMLEYVRWQETLQPKRLPCPVRTDKPLAELLSEQFSLPVIAEEPDIADVLARYRGGHEGQTSAEALKRLCDTFDCIPKLTPNALMLCREKGAEIHMNDALCRIDRKQQGKRVSEIFLFPERGKLVGSVEATTNDRYKIAPSSLATQMRKAADLNLPLEGGAVRSVVALAPQTAIMEARLSQPMSIGPQEFCITNMVANEDGSWTTFMTGSVFEEIPWMETTGAEDRYIRLLATASGFTVTAETGERIVARGSNMHFFCRKFSLQLHTPAKPASIEIRAYTAVTTSRLHLP